MSGTSMASPSNVEGALKFNQLRTGTSSRDERDIYIVYVKYF